MLTNVKYVTDITSGSLTDTEPNVNATDANSTNRIFAGVSETVASLDMLVNDVLFLVENIIYEDAPCELSNWSRVSQRFYQTPKALLWRQFSSARLYDRPKEAIKIGNQELFRLAWKQQQDVIDRNDVMECAIEHGNFEAVKHLRETMKVRLRPILDTKYPWLAVKHKHHEILRYLLQEGCPLVENTLDEIVRQCDFELLTVVFCTVKITERVLNRLMNAAMTNNRQTLVEYLYNLKYRKPVLFKDACRSAVASNNLAVLQWMRNPSRSQSFSWDETCYAEVMKTGNLKILVWLYRNGCPYNKTIVCQLAVCAKRVFGANLEELRALADNRDLSESEIPAKIISQKTSATRRSRMHKIDLDLESI